MRIGMIAPLVESVPPRKYGGTERVVSALTEILVERGHEVTLFASGDSQTAARLVACVPRSLRLDSIPLDPMAAVLWQLSQVASAASQFEVIHNHVGWPALSFARLCSTPTLTTVHGRLDLPEENLAYGMYSDQPFVSISMDQRRPLTDANWLGTVYDGIDLDRFTFRSAPGDYLVFLGRICPEKRPDRAIALAASVGMRLIIAAKVDAVDREYYETEIRPLIEKTPRIEYVGEVNDQEKDELLGKALACLFPIDWPEPFGLTMVEAMATGTPVIAWRTGSVPEVIEDGVTGFLGTSMHELELGLGRVESLNRLECRLRVERLFSAERMADDYEAAYQQLAGVDGKMSQIPLFAGRLPERVMAMADLKELIPSGDGARETQTA